MIRHTFACLLAAALAALAAGCGLASSPGSSEVRLSVTRAFGATRMDELTLAYTDGAGTATDLLARRLHVRTSHGGDVVDAVAGVSAGIRDGRPFAWFLYVNGIEAKRGAAPPSLNPGDRIWWDFHAYGAAPGSPAVVGSYPEPFQHGSGGERAPVRVECADGADAACGVVLDRLQAAGVPAGRGGLGTGVGQKTLRVLVGPWSELRLDAAAARLTAGVRASGVYARFEGARLALLDERGAVARTLGPAAGLLAATRFEQQLPTWLVTGGSIAGVNAAAAALDERDLHDRFALAIDGGRRIPVPAP